MIKKFAVKFIIFTLPFSLVGISYFVFDPFKVLYHYNSFYEDFVTSVNRDYASSRLFVQQYDTYHYNAFILGSSRTLGFQMQDWQTHLEKSARPYKFDASSETLTGIYAKVKFLDKKNVDIENALVIICPDVTFDKLQRKEGAQVIEDPEVEGEYRYLGFHQTIFTSYLRDYFFIKYLKSKWLESQGKLRGMDLQELKADAVTNDLIVSYWERELEKDTIAFYRKRDSVFYKHKAAEEILPAQINEDMKMKLQGVKNIFDKRKTNYEIVISPLYDQKKINAKDLNIMRQIFGKSKVHDFSGINEITVDKFNYYESSHFRPVVGRQIMDEIYSDQF